MADDLGLGQTFAPAAKGFASGAYTTVWIIGLLIMVGGIIWFVWWWFSHNRLLIINFVTKDGVKLLVTDMAKKTHFKGAEYWKLRRLKKMWLAPPGDCIRITNKGKFSAECTYHEADDHPIWVKLVDSEITNRDGIRVNDHQAYFSPEDRSLLVEQLEEAENRKKKLLDWIMQMTAPAMILMFFVLVLVFWGNIWEPMQQSQIQMATISAEQAKISEQNTRLFLVLAGKLEKNELTLKQVVPADSQLFNVNSTIG